MNRISTAEMRKVNGGFRVICNICGYTIKTLGPVSGCLLANAMNYHQLKSHGTAGNYTTKWW